MRRVPLNTKYLLIGSGKLHKHLSHYFELLKIPYSTWNRQSSTTSDLHNKLNSHQYALMAISDDQICKFYEDFNTGTDCQFIHFSGALYHPEILGFHPLMSFSDELYENHLYSRIQFIGDAEESKFREILPFSQNPYSKIAKEHKALYHSLCVLSGNGTTLLWDLVAKEFSKIGVPVSSLELYQSQIAKNITEQQPGRFTGPWFRKDKTTQTKNLAALKDSALASLYSCFNRLADTSGE